MRISMLGQAGYVIENDDGLYLSAYGLGRFTAVQENARVFDSWEAANWAKLSLTPGFDNHCE